MSRGWEHIRGLLADPEPKFGFAAAAAHLSRAPGLTTIGAAFLASLDTASQALSPVAAILKGPHCEHRREPADLSEWNFLPGHLRFDWWRADIVVGPLVPGIQG